MRFAPGRVVVHRNVRRGRIGWVRPARVVSDDDRGLLLWVARGTQVASEVTADGRGMRTMPFTEWVAASTYRLRVASWAGPPVLKFLPAGADHSVWFFRDAADRFANWYVNLEEHGVRWDDGELAGVDVVDQDLDVVVWPDHTWEWKDEGEFAERLAVPEHYWVPDPAAVRAEGERVIKIAESAQFPFDGTWCDFVPDPAWTAPDLPPGWDRPPVR
ncbi:DUF402 domain-containing protein [Micromonosporaceae bacterium B7E4]